MDNLVVAKNLLRMAKDLMAEVGDVEIIEPVDSKPVKTRRTKKMDARIRLTELLAEDDGRAPETGSTLDLLERMGDEDSKDVAKGEFKVASSRKADTIAQELLIVARECIAVSDEEFIADQLNNAWEVTPEREMINHLAKETRYGKSALKPLVEKWYGDVRLRMKMDLARTTSWVSWLKKELS